MEAKQKIYFIANPISGSAVSKRRKNNLHASLQDFLDPSKYEYVVKVTEYQGHGIALAKEAVASGYDIIVAVGGDGTINEIARTLVNTDAVMAIIPAGSGNGLARHLCIPLAFKGAIEVINAGHVLKIDTGTVGPLESETKSDMVFISSCGVGFDAYMSSKFAQLKNRGMWGYIKAIYKEYFSYQAGTYELKFNGQVIEEKALLITVANSPQYGNNAVISPGAKLDNGLLDICVVYPFPLHALPGMVRRLFNNSIDKSKYITIYRTKELVITGSSAKVQFDGDFFELDKKVLIKVNPGSLNLIAPKNT